MRRPRKDGIEPGTENQKFAPLTKSKSGATAKKTTTTKKSTASKPPLIGGRPGSAASDSMRKMTPGEREDSAFRKDVNDAMKEKATLNNITVGRRGFANPAQNAKSKVERIQQDKKSSSTRVGPPAGMKPSPSGPGRSVSPARPKKPVSPARPKKPQVRQSPTAKKK
jgi:hypothetical protein